MVSPVHLLGQVLNAVQVLQTSTNEAVVKMDKVLTKMEDMEKRLEDIETTNTSRDQSYNRLLNPIFAACVKTNPFHIQWPLQTLEELHAVEAQMGFIAFDNFLVSIIDSCDFTN